MRRVLIVLIGVSALLVAAPAQAADRLDVLAAELRERPLAVDAEMAWLLDDREEARLRRVLEDGPVPFHVAVLPLFEDDESGGDGRRVAFALHRRLGRDGLYVVVSQTGFFDVRPYAVKRDLDLFGNLVEFPPRGGELSGSEIVARLSRLVRNVASSPPGTSDSDAPLAPLRGYREPVAPAEDESTGDAALGAAFTFGAIGLLAGGALRVAHRRRSTRAKR